MASGAIINYIAMFGFLLSAVSYLSHMFVAFESVYFVIGMLLISVGYTSLFVVKLLGLLKERKEREQKKTDALTEDEGDNPKDGWDVKAALQYFGYGMLFTFFGLIYFKPEFTLHYRFYDAFAAVGYFLMMLTKYIPLALALFPVVLYYLFGGLHKIHEKGWINKLQLVARSLLLVYYGATLISALHLF